MACVTGLIYRLSINAPYPTFPPFYHRPVRFSSDHNRHRRVHWHRAGDHRRHADILSVPGRLAEFCLSTRGAEGHGLSRGTEGGDDRLFRSGTAEGATGRIGISGKSLDRLRPLYRWGTLPTVIIFTAFGVWFCSVALRLCRNVAAQRAFTEENILILHRLGLGLMIATLLMSGAEAWFYYKTWGPTDAVIRSQFANVQLAHPARDHQGGILYSDTNAAKVPAALDQADLSDFSRVVYFHLDPMDFLLGAGLLALGEVFRQGLKLQREADLTV